MGQGFFVHTRQSDSLLGCGVSYLNREFFPHFHSCVIQLIWGSISKSLLLGAKLNHFGWQTQCFWMLNSLLLRSHLHAY